MYFNNGSLDRCNSITNSNRSMRKSSGIKNDSIKRITNTLYLIDQFTFDIALKIVELNRRILLFQFFKISFEWLITVDICFAFAKQVKVGAINDRYLHNTNLSKPVN